MTTWRCLVLMLLFGGCASEIGPKGKSVGKPIGQLLHQTEVSHKAVDIFGGFAHACVHLDDGRASCWGLNENGQCNLQSARNAAGILHDVSNAQFSKLAAGTHFTCGIVKDAPFSGIAFCAGKEGPWLDIPNEPIKDISASEEFICFLNGDGKLGCVGKVLDVVMIDERGPRIEKIDPREFTKFGIDPITKKTYQDFSEKRFKDLRAGEFKICARGADDDLIYCMGNNLHHSSEIPTLPVLDYSPANSDLTFIISKSGDLTNAGASFNYGYSTKVADLTELKYKKFFPSPSDFLLSTTGGNHYSDGAAIPENTLIAAGLIEEGVIGAVKLNSSRSKDRHRVVCMLKDNHKVKCALPQGYRSENNDTLLNDIPRNIAY